MAAEWPREAPPPACPRPPGAWAWALLLGTLRLLGLSFSLPGAQASETPGARASSDSGPSSPLPGAQRWPLDEPPPGAREPALSSSNRANERSFILLKPTPFLYVRCCVRALCNTDSPELNETEANYYRETGRASDVRSSSVWLVPLLMLSPGLTGLRLP